MNVLEDGQEEIGSHNKYANQFDNRVMKKILHQPAAGILVHWTFQGLLYMDKTERLFKILLDLSLMILFTPLFRYVFDWKLSLVAAFIVGHTVNFLFNSQFWVVLKHYDLVFHTYSEFTKYLEGITERIRLEPSLKYAAAYGSLSRDEWKTSSDLDLCLVRQDGWINGWKACVFVLKERSRALIRKFPLDIHVLDSYGVLMRLRTDEEPIVFKG